MVPLYAIPFENGTYTRKNLNYVAGVLDRHTLSIKSGLPLSGVQVCVLTRGSGDNFEPVHKGALNEGIPAVLFTRYVSEYKFIVSGVEKAGGSIFIVDHYFAYTDKSGARL